MTHKIATTFLVALIACGMTACSTTSESGAMENAGANAGRVLDDSAITAKVKTALIRDETTKAHQIEVETFKGTVQLSGFVDDAEARQQATQVARNIEGVKDVKNSLQVRGGG